MKKKTKIFFITSEIPARVGGAPVRNFNLIHQIPKDKFDVSIFTIVNEKSKGSLHDIKKEINSTVYTVSLKNFNFLKKLHISLIKRVIPYLEEYRESGLETVLLNKIYDDQPDIIQLEQIKSFYVIKDLISFIKEKNIKIILDAHNVEQVVLKESLRSFGLIKSNIGKWILPNYVKIENKAITSVDHIFTCSDIDKTYFGKLVNSKKITIIPNGADLKYFNSGEEALGDTLLFMGGAQYPPNEEALKYYFSDMHTLIKKSIPNIKIYVLCGKSPKWLKEIAENDPSIILPGFISDVREYLNKAKVCISPIKSGSGTRLKILEYMSMGKPVVSTSKGAEGLEVENNKNILISDNSNEFARKIIWLIQNSEKAKNIGDNARILIEEKYDWNTISKKMVRVYLELQNETN